MWVIEFGTINGTSATGVVLAVVAAVVVGGVNIFGGTGTLVGAALGALFLGFIANALILVGLSQFWLQAIYGVVILVAVSADALILRRIQRADRRAARPMSAASPRRGPAARGRDSLARWETLLRRRPARADRARQRALAVLPDARQLREPASPPSWKSRSWPCR